MSPHPLRWTLVTVALAGLAALGSPADGPKSTSAPPDAAFFDSKIRPVLTATCVKCHGDKKIRGGLRLVSRAALLEGGDHGPAVVPNSPEKSLLIQALRHTHPDVKMPPNQRLPDSVINDFAAWVKAGTAWPAGTTRQASSSSATPWVFRHVRKVEPPPDPDGWSAKPIDRFIRAPQRRHGLDPAGSADRRTLLRRATFDLTGLPPTPAEVDAFLADRSPGAWERVVDRLLASPRYGER
jgi:hypothetical protein